jgi:hypothetical protein
LPEVFRMLAVSGGALAELLITTKQLKGKEKN